jgi:hypothetical protein
LPLSCEVAAAAAADKKGSTITHNNNNADTHGTPTSRATMNSRSTQLVYWTTGLLFLLGTLTWLVISIVALTRDAGADRPTTIVNTVVASIFTVGQLALFGVTTNALLTSIRRRRRETTTTTTTTTTDDGLSAYSADSAARDATTS